MKINSQSLAVVTACRQLLREYALDAKVFVADSDDLETIRTFTVKKLLPSAFALVH